MHCVISWKKIIPTLPYPKIFMLISLSASLNDWIGFKVVFNKILVIAKRQLDYPYMVWKSLVLGLGSEVTWPYILRRNTEWFQRGSIPRHPSHESYTTPLNHAGSIACSGRYVVLNSVSCQYTTKATAPIHEFLGTVGLSLCQIM